MILSLLVYHRSVKSVAKLVNNTCKNVCRVFTVRCVCYVTFIASVTASFSGLNARSDGAGLNIPCQFWIVLMCGLTFDLVPRMTGREAASVPVYLSKTECLLPLTLYPASVFFLSSTVALPDLFLLAP